MRSRACGILSANGRFRDRAVQDKADFSPSPSEAYFKSKAISGLQPSYKQNASIVKQGYYGTGVIQAAEKLQKRGSKKAMESELSSESSGEAPRTKVVVRRLPPSLLERAFMESMPSQIRGSFNWISFSPGKPSKKRSTSRAYIDFKHPKDVFRFFEEFNGHLYVNERGTPYRASVEYAPHQKVPKRSEKADAEEGSISEDPDYMDFLEASSKPVKLLPSAEVQLERIEAEKRSRLGTGTYKMIVVTPLMDYVRRRRVYSTENIYMANKKKTVWRGSTGSVPLANSIVSSTQGSNKLNGFIKCPSLAVKPTHMSRRLLEANRCKDICSDARRKAGFAARGKVVSVEKSLITQGTSRHSVGNCGQMRTDQKQQRADMVKKCKQRTSFRSHEKQVWVAKSELGKGT